MPFGENTAESMSDVATVAAGQGIRSITIVTDPAHAARARALAAVARAGRPRLVHPRGSRHHHHERLPAARVGRAGRRLARSLTPVAGPALGRNAAGPASARQPYPDPRGEPRIRRRRRAAVGRRGTQAPHRTAFARDRARLVHSAGWRRLAAKTQVMIAGEGDFARTRMTHSLEVAQVGRELGAGLGCDPDLVETACLAHDLGHPPFGHNGEDALAEVARRHWWLRGQRADAAHPHPAGGQGVRHAGGPRQRALRRAQPDPGVPGCSDQVPVAAPGTGRQVRGLRRRRAGVRVVPRGRHARARPFEAQIMDWADDVAYSVHDVEDGLEAGHIDLRALADPACAPSSRPWRRELPARRAARSRGRGAGPVAWPAVLAGRLRRRPAGALAGLKDMTSQLIGRFTAAAEQATREAHPQARLTRHHGTLVVPAAVRLEVGVLKAVANLFVMQRSGSQRGLRPTAQIIQELVNALVLGAPGRAGPAAARRLAGRRGRRRTAAGRGRSGRQPDRPFGGRRMPGRSVHRRSRDVRGAGPASSRRPCSPAVPGSAAVAAPLTAQRARPASSRATGTRNGEQDT